MYNDVVTHGTDRDVRNGHHHHVSSDIIVASIRVDAGHLDVKTAFLNVPVEEDVWVIHPHAPCSSSPQKYRLRPKQTENRTHPSTTTFPNRFQLVTFKLTNTGLVDVGRRFSGSTKAKVSRGPSGMYDSS